MGKVPNPARKGDMWSFGQTMLTSPLREVFFCLFLEAVLKLGFSVEISRHKPAGQEREAEDQPTGILKYVEDLRRGLNADLERKDFFEMTSRLIWRSGR
jgi:hypothetical protein